MFRAYGNPLIHNRDQISVVNLDFDEAIYKRCGHNLEKEMLRYKKKKYDYIFYEIITIVRSCFLSKS